MKTIKLLRNLLLFTRDFHCCVACIQKSRDLLFFNKKLNDIWDGRPGNMTEVG